MDVKQKQCLLYVLGYYVGEIDGKWGTMSKTATKAFQKDFGLTVDGIPGEETVKALKHAVCYGMPAKVEDEPASGDFWDGIKYFRKEEFACRCGCGADEMNKTLIKAAVKVREHFKAPVIVSSGRRCAKHNARVGGVSNSRHIANPGKAMDFCVSGFSASMTLEYVQKLPEIRYAYAIDGSYVHMEVN